MVSKFRIASQLTTRVPVVSTSPVPLKANEVTLPKFALTVLMTQAAQLPPDIISRKRASSRRFTGPPGMSAGRRFAIYARD
ncbi:hypothetical protein D3C76_1691920 [compost metagenome]